MDSQEARIYLTVIITVLVLGVIIIYFTISVIRQQRKNLELQKANALAEISAMEKERARLATDLHDDLGPILSTIKFRIDYVKTAKPGDMEELFVASGQLDELITRMREVANNLMPGTLKRNGFIGAVQEFVNSVSQTNRIQIECMFNDSLSLNDDKSINLFRVIQEIVNNALKHSGAEKLEIIFQTSSNAVKIICRDNGKGFDIGARTKEQTGMGLRSIRNRTEIIGGQLTIESKPGKGTAFLIELPLP